MKDDEVIQTQKTTTWNQMGFYFSCSVTSSLFLNRNVVDKWNYVEVVVSPVPLQPCMWSTQPTCKHGFFCANVSTGVRENWFRICITQNCSNYKSRHVITTHLPTSSSQSKLESAKWGKLSAFWPHRFHESGNMIPRKKNWKETIITGRTKNSI